MRERGAKVTDMIVLVISAVESVQRQTIEVINTVNELRIPLIVAINKIDREEADVEKVLFDLEGHGVVSEDLGGNICTVPISAKESVNINQLENKIIELAD
jgi:translation initiation factor IF-2